MYTTTDFDKLRQIMAESPEHADVISRLLDSYRESVSTITHEIRNPLTLVYSSLQLIESSHPEVHTFQHWDTMHQDILYMMQLLTDLSDYNNSYSLHKKPLNTSVFLKQLVLSFAASSEALDVEFTSHIAPELPAIQADAPKLKEVLLNLLKNAFEAIPSGTAGSVRLQADTIDTITHTATGAASGTADSSAIASASSYFPGAAAETLSTAAQGFKLRIQISDNGCGIPAEHLEKIYTPFVTFKSDGTGLGLSLSKRIIEAHGGTLQAESDLNTGTIFTILLPVPSVSVPAPSGSSDTE